MANLLTRVAWQARLAEPALPGRPLDSRALATDLDDLVTYMLFAEEARLVEPVEGVSSFAAHVRRARARATVVAARCATSTCRRGCSAIRSAT